MVTAVHTTQRAETRILDGSGTPNYLILPFVQPGGQFPIARARPAQVPRLNRGIIDEYAHYTRGPDEPIIAPIVVSLTVWMDEQIGEHVLQALCNPYRTATWTVGDGTFTSAAGTGTTILNGAGVAVPVPQADDPEHDRVHVEWLFKGRVAGTNDTGWRHEECYFPPELQNHVEGDPNAINLVYHCFGAIFPIEAFTAGTNITPALS